MILFLLYEQFLYERGKQSSSFCWLPQNMTITFVANVLDVSQSFCRIDLIEPIWHKKVELRKMYNHRSDSIQATDYIAIQVKGSLGQKYWKYKRETLVEI